MQEQDTTATTPLRIVSDGTKEGTHVLVDGRELKGVTNVEWKMNTRKRSATVILEMQDVALDTNQSVPDEVAEALRTLSRWQQD
jgi:hypothetical protein